MSQTLKGCHFSLSRRKSENPLWSRVVAGLTLVAFLVSDFGFSGTTDLVSPAQEKPRQNESLISKVEISPSLGVLKSKFVGKPDTLVIHVQDIHCNFEAQSNSAKIIHDLVKKHDRHGLKLVGLEGAEGLVDTSFLTAFPRSDIRLQVARYLLQRGKISGPEYLSIVEEKPLLIKGIEDLGLYFDNLLAFDEGASLREQVKPLFDKFELAIQLLEKDAYPAQVLELMQKEEDYNVGKMSFAAFLAQLMQGAVQSGIRVQDYPNIGKMMKVQEKETSIEFKKVEDERLAITNALSRELVKEEISDLLAQSLYYRLEKIGAYQYFTHFENVVSKSEKLHLSDYPNLDGYIAMVKIFNAIDKDELFNECDRFSKKIQEKLLKSSEGQELYQVSRDVRLLKNLYHLELTRTDLKYYYENADELKATILAKRLQRVGDSLGKHLDLGGMEFLDEHTAPLKEFYSTAEKRDEMLVLKTLQEMEKAKSPIAVMVAGGFHTEGIAKKLAQKGVSYLVVAPKITKVTLQTPYLSIMTDAKSPLEELIKSAENRYALGPLSLNMLHGMLKTLLGRPELSREKVELILTKLDMGKSFDRIATGVLNLVSGAQLSRWVREGEGEKAVQEAGAISEEWLERLLQFLDGRVKQGLLTREEMGDIRAKFEDSRRVISTNPAEVKKYGKYYFVPITIFGEKIGGIIWKAEIVEKGEDLNVDLEEGILPLARFEKALALARQEYEPKKMPPSLVNAVLKELVGMLEAGKAALRAAGREDKPRETRQKLLREADRVTQSILTRARTLSERHSSDSRARELLDQVLAVRAEITKVYENLKGVDITAPSTVIASDAKQSHEIASVAKGDLAMTREFAAPVASFGNETEAPQDDMEEAVINELAKIDQRLAPPKAVLATYREKPISAGEKSEQVLRLTVNALQSSYEAVQILLQRFPTDERVKLKLQDVVALTKELRALRERMRQGAVSTSAPVISTPASVIARQSASGGSEAKQSHEIASAAKGDLAMTRKLAAPAATSPQIQIPGLNIFIDPRYFLGRSKKRYAKLGMFQKMFSEKSLVHKDKTVAQWLEEWQRELIQKYPRVADDLNLRAIKIVLIYEPQFRESIVSEANRLVINVARVIATNDFQYAFEDVLLKMARSIEEDFQNQKLPEGLGLKQKDLPLWARFKGIFERPEVDYDHGKFGRTSLGGQEALIVQEYEIPKYQDLILPSGQRLPESFTGLVEATSPVLTDADLDEMLALGVFSEDQVEQMRVGRDQNTVYAYDVQGRFGLEPTRLAIPKPEESNFSGVQESPEAIAIFLDGELKAVYRKAGFYVEYENGRPRRLYDSGEGRSFELPHPDDPHFSGPRSEGGFLYEYQNGALVSFRTLNALEEILGKPLDLKNDEFSLVFHQGKPVAVQRLDRRGKSEFFSVREGMSDEELESLKIAYQETRPTALERVKNKIRWRYHFSADAAAGIKSLYEAFRDHPGPLRVSLQRMISLARKRGAGEKLTSQEALRLAHREAQKRGLSREDEELLRYALSPPPLKLFSVPPKEYWRLWVKSMPARVLAGVGIGILGFQSLGLQALAQDGGMPVGFGDMPAVDTAGRATPDLPAMVYTLPVNQVAETILALDREISSMQLALRTSSVSEGMADSLRDQIAERNARIQELKGRLRGNRTELAKLEAGVRLKKNELARMIASKPAPKAGVQGMNRPPMPKVVGLDQAIEHAVLTWKLVPRTEVDIARILYEAQQRWDRDLKIDLSLGLQYRNDTWYGQGGPGSGGAEGNWQEIKYADLRALLRVAYTIDPARAAATEFALKNWNKAQALSKQEVPA